MTDRVLYEIWYRRKIINDAILAYGNKCACKHCVLPFGFRPLRIILIDEKKHNQYQIALFLKRMKYVKGLAKVFCYDCSDDVCKHDYQKSTTKKYSPPTEKIKFTQIHVIHK